MAGLEFFLSPFSVRLFWCGFVGIKGWHGNLLKVCEKIMFCWGLASGWEWMGNARLEAGRNSGVDMSVLSKISVLHLTNLRAVFINRLTFVTLISSNSLGHSCTCRTFLFLALFDGELRHPFHSFDWLLIKCWVLTLHGGRGESMFLNKRFFFCMQASSHVQHGAKDWLPMLQAKWLAPFVIVCYHRFNPDLGRHFL